MKRILGFAVGTVLCLALAGATAMADDNLTVGDFAVRMANALNLNAPASGFEAGSALAALREAGVVLDGDVSSELREADMVDALSQLGLNLTTSNPDRTVTPARADLILKAFDGALQTETSSSDKGNTPPGGGFGRGGKKNASPSDG